jgi:Alcohol dehydrogenase GroES-like domain
LERKLRMLKLVIKLLWNLKNLVDCTYPHVSLSVPRVLLMGSCEYCRTGRYNLCPDIKFAATPPYDGTLTKYYVLPYDMVIPLPSGVSLEEGGTLPLKLE